MRIKSVTSFSMQTSLRLKMEDFKTLSVSGLRTFLATQGISTKTLDNFSNNMVSGLAMTLLDEGEIKELAPIIGDRAVLRNMLKKLEQESLSTEAPISSMATMLDNHVVSGLLHHGIKSNTTSTPASSVDLSFASNYPSSESSIGIVESNIDTKLLNTEDNFLHQRSFDDFQEVSEEFDRTEEIQIEPPLAKIRKTDIQEVKPKKRISVRKQEMPLPKPFEVPHNFTPNVEDALESKSLNGKTRAKFITLIAQSIYRYKSYPTSEELDHVVQQLYKKWPFLECSRYSLQVAIRMRLGYMRKPEDRKRGNANHSSPSQSKVQQPKKPAFPSEDLTTITGEDQNSMHRHLRFLSSELKKVVPNKNVCQELMTRTFPMRRQDIKAGNLSVMDCLVKYPALRFPAQILLDFDLIFPQKDQLSTARIKWDTAVPKILQIDHRDGSKGISQFTTEEETDEKSRGIIALFCLCFSIRDARVKIDHNRVISLVNVESSVELVAKNMPSPQPCLIVKRSKGIAEDCYLVMEKTTISKVEVEDAVLILFAAFFVFNLHYPHGCTNLYTIMEAILLEKTVTGRKPMVSAFLDRLTKQSVIC